MPNREPTPGDQVAFIRFHGTSCRFCLNDRPHPGDLARMRDKPEDTPGSVWSLLMEGLDE